MVFWLAYSSVSLPSVARYAYTNQEEEHRNKHSRCKGTAFPAYMQMFLKILRTFNTTNAKCKKLLITTER